jgi:chromosome partitioning protein
VTRSRRAPGADTEGAVPAVGASRIIAIANQKGGVGKTTTAVSLGASLAEMGYRVLVVDLDPQGNASTGMGIKHEARAVTVYDVILSEAPAADAIVSTPVPGLFAIPSTIDLAGAEIELVSQFSRETRLKRALGSLEEDSYDFILLDCPPSLGLLTVNALTAAEELIVPIQCEYYALEGLGQLLRNVSLVQQNINPDLRLSGIVMTMFDPRTKLSEQVVAEVQRFFGDVVYDVIIPRTVRLSEAPGYGLPITMYDPKSRGAECYRQLAREVSGRPVPVALMPSLDDLSTVVVTTPFVLNERDATPEPLDDDAVEAVPTVHELVEDTQPISVEPVRDGSVGDAEPPAGETIVVAAAPPDDPDEDVWEDVAEAGTSRTTTRVGSPAPDRPERRVVVIDENADPRAGLERPGESGSAATTGTPNEGSAGIGATLHDGDAETRRRRRRFRKGGE